MSQYIVFEAHDLTTNESRVHSFELGSAPLVDYSDVLGCDYKVIAEMLRKYIAMDTSLTAMEGYHFTNWALNFNKLSDLKKDRTKLLVRLYHAQSDEEFKIIATELADKAQRLADKTIIRQLNVA